MDKKVNFEDLCHVVEDLRQTCKLLGKNPRSLHYNFQSLAKLLGVRIEVIELPNDGADLPTEPKG